MAARAVSDHYGVACGGASVGRELVEDHAIVRLQCRHRVLHDIGEVPFHGHRTVDHHGEG